MQLRILSPLHRATRQLTLFLEGELESAGVTPRDAHLLSYLGGYAPCSAGELARVFGLRKSTLTGKLDRLEGQGLLAREVAPDDGRSLLVRLTAAGKRQAKRVDRVVQRFERRVLGSVTATELLGFERVMRAIEKTTGVDVRPPNTARRSP